MLGEQCSHLIPYSSLSDYCVCVFFFFFYFFFYFFFQNCLFRTLFMKHYKSISHFIVLSKNRCWPTKCFIIAHGSIQHGFLKRTISDHSHCGPEIMLLFQKMAWYQVRPPFLYFCSPDVAATFFFFKFMFQKNGFVFKIWFYLRYLHPGVHFINCPHIFLSRELNWL